MNGRFSAFGLTLALAYGFAVLVHGVIHAVAVDAGVIVSLPHALMAGSALAFLALAARVLGAGATNAERRRRLALVRARVARSGRGVIAGMMAIEAVLAIGLFFTEGAAPDLPRFGVALVSGLIALALTAIVIRGVRRQIVAVIAAFVAALDAGGSCRRILTPHAPPLAHARAVLHRRLRFRGPPTLLAFR